MGFVKIRSSSLEYSSNLISFFEFSFEIFTAHSIFIICIAH